MELNYFKDKLFDLQNDSEGMGIADLNADERNNLLIVRTEDGNVFEIVCRMATDKGDGKTQTNSLFIMGEGLSKKRRRRFFCRGNDSPQGIKSP